MHGEACELVKWSYPPEIPSEFYTWFVGIVEKSDGEKILCFVKYLRKEGIWTRHSKKYPVKVLAWKPASLYGEF